MKYFLFEFLYYCVITKHTSVTTKVNAAIQSAKREIEMQVKQCDKTYQFGGLEKFKADLLDELKPAYEKINTKLQNDLISMYKRAESDLTSKYIMCCHYIGHYYRFVLITCYVHTVDSNYY